MYSAFIFPGAGYFIIKDKKKGYAFTAITIACLVFVLYDAMIKARIMADELVQKLSHNGIIDLQDLSQFIPHLPAYVREQMLLIEGPFPASFITGLSIFLGVIWLIGLVGCYYHGKQYDQKSPL